MVSAIPSLLPLAESAPAGGAALDQVAIATAIGLGLGAFVVWLGAGHRSGRVRYLGRAAAWAGRVTGLPGWAALPSLVSAASLLVAVLGMYWDISFHIDAGRDPGPLANPAHYLILFGLFGIFTAGYFAVSLPEGRRWRRSASRSRRSASTPPRWAASAPGSAASASSRPCDARNRHATPAPEAAAPQAAASASSVCCSRSGGCARA